VISWVLQLEFPRSLPPNLYESVNPLLVFACAFGGALFGMFIKRLPPAQHISPESTEVGRVAMGMVATIVALVLGLLAYSAKGFYDTQTAEVTQLAANVLLLDRVLAHYGPESTEVRAELQPFIQRHLKLLWPERDPRRPTTQSVNPTGEVVLDKIQQLSPKDDRQRSLHAHALSLALSNRADSIPDAHATKRTVAEALLLVMLMFWLIALFMSFGSFAPSNFIMVVSLFVRAARVCGAVFLMVEMYYPYAGLIESRPLLSSLLLPKWGNRRWLSTLLAKTALLPSKLRTRSRLKLLYF